MRNVTLAVLAGGEGVRMGKPKALLEVGGQPILRHILQSAKWLGPTLLVTSPGREYPLGADGFDREVVDPVAGLGPMRGVLTALEHSATDCIVVVPVDMPAVGSIPLHRLAQAILEQPATMVLFLRRVIDGEAMIETLPASFRRGARDLLKARIEDGRRSLYRLADESTVRCMAAPGDWPDEVWTNLNRPADVELFERGLDE